MGDFRADLQRPTDKITHLTLVSLNFATRVYHPETKELREIDRIEIPHAEQSKQWHNDIALLHLRTPLSTNARATLSAPNLPIIRAGHGVVWGKGQFSMNNPGGILRADYATLRLRKAQVPINKPAFCGKPAYGQHLLCAETPSTNGSSPALCSGDSGGPLTIFSDNPNTQLQVGVVSHAEQVPGRPFCGGQPTWYTSVSHWAPWINERVAGVKYGTYRINPADGAPMAPTPASMFGLAVTAPTWNDKSASKTVNRNFSALIYRIPPRLMN